MGKHHTVLVIDDDRDQLAVLAEVLANEGCAVWVANNGQQAIGAIEGGLQPCVILLDLQMPVVNGWEFATKLASLGETAASIRWLCCRVSHTLVGCHSARNIAC